jgi:signal peptidase I
MEQQTQTQRNIKKFKSWLKNILYWTIHLVIAILLAIILRIFLFAVFTIPTSSMHPAIVSGDQVVVNKMIPGPRIIRNFFSLYKDKKPDIKRLSGYRAVQRNDVLIFNFPYSGGNHIEMDLGLFYAKRCVAIAGDTFYIENGIYKVKGCADTLGNYAGQSSFFKILEEEIRPEIFHCFPDDTLYQWTVKSFGPLYVPRSGDTLPVDAQNISLYKNLIHYETGKEITVRNDTVFLDKIPMCNYTFRQNYYFMAGDLIYDSRDSRYWGLLPEDHIVGKIAFIWNTKDKATGKKSWKRFLKKV